MAYPNYQYPGYQPVPYYTGPVPDQLSQLRQNQQLQNVQQFQPQMMQSQPMQTPTTANPMAGSAQNGMIWVSGRQEVDGFIVAPNCAVPLWDANAPVIYLRKADSTGKPSTVIYDLVERTEATAKQETPQTQQVDLSRYMTIEDAEEMIDRRVNEVLSERFRKPSKSAGKKEDE